MVIRFITICVVYIIGLMDSFVMDGDFIWSGCRGDRDKRGRLVRVLVLCVCVGILGILGFSFSFEIFLWDCRGSREFGVVKRRLVNME